MPDARLVHAVSGHTLKEIHNPIAWLFRNDRIVSSFNSKALDDGSGLLIAFTDDGRELHMIWADYRVMCDRLFKSRAWRNHFGGTLVMNMRSGNRRII